jgi:hypothetical protein
LGRAIRCALFVLASLLADPANAQTTAPSAEVARASRALAAIWRPLSGAITPAAIETACAGALEELAAVEAALPAVITPDSLARVRALHGLLIIPAETPAASYFFPPAEYDWFASGLGAITVINEAEGFIAVRDAAGRDIALQLGRAGRRAMLRLRAPEGAVLTLVGCAPTAR